MKKLVFSTLVALLLPVIVLVLGGCGGAGGGAATTTTGIKKTAVNGTVLFPVISFDQPGKRVAGIPASVATLTITDLSGVEIARPTLTVDLADPKTFTYTASLDPGKNYIFKASWGGQVLRTLADKSVLNAAIAKIKVTPVSTAMVLVVEKSLELIPGTLGTASATSEQANAVAASLAALPPGAIENNILTALSACTSATGTVSAAQAQLASLANIVEAAIISKVDAAAFIAGNGTAATVTAVIYTPFGGRVTGTSSVVNSTDVSSAVATTTATLPKITSDNNTIFTVGSVGNFAVTGTGTLSVGGTLPAGVVFDAAAAALTGTPAAGSTGMYRVSVTATSNGLKATQDFTLTVNAAVVGGSSFTSAMISGKAFTYSLNGSAGTVTFKADNTSSTGGTWLINSSGQLVYKPTATITNTMTLLSATVTTLIATDVYTNNGITSVGTMTLTEISGGSFTTAMGSYNGTLYKNGVVNDFFTITVNSTGKVAGANASDGVALYGALTASVATGKYNYAGTAISNGATLAQTAILDTSTGKFTGTMNNPNSASVYTWTAMKFTTAPDFSSAVGSYTVTSSHTVQGVMTVDSTGNVTITDGGTVVGKGKLNVTAIITAFDVIADFTDSDTFQGSLDTVTGKFSGTVNDGSGTWSAQRQSNGL